MDDELQVVVTSILEADEEESARRISSQLPSISKKVNEKGRVKVQLELDTDGLQAETQKVAKQAAKIPKVQVGMKVNVDKDIVDKMKNELESLHVNSDIAKSVTAEMDELGVRIDSVSGAWKDSADGAQRMLNLTIQGTDQQQRTLSIVKQFAYIEGEVEGQLEEQSTTVTRITANFEKQRQTQEKIASKTKKDNDERIAYLGKQQALLDKINASYTGKTSAKKITDESHLNDIKAKYDAIQSSLTEYGNTSGKISAQQKVELERQISELELLVKEYQNTEYVATKLRAKPIEVVKSEQISALEEYKKKLQESGIFTEDFESRIEGLKTQINGAFDAQGLTDFLNQFAVLKSDVGSFKADISKVNNIYSKLIAVNKEINNTKISMTKTDSSSEKYKDLELQLSYNEEIAKGLEDQLDPYKSIIEYATRYKDLQEQNVKNTLKLLAAIDEVKDKANYADSQKGTVRNQIDDINERFKQIKDPTAELQDKVKNLGSLMKQFDDTSEDQKKVEVFQKLLSAISGCNKEITRMLGLDKLDLLDDKFNTNLNKAKTDLETIRRQWSAFTSDPALRKQFAVLQNDIGQITSSSDLSRWQTQLNAFKSSIKAAGLNQQSMLDTLENNLKKVGSWLSATSIIFKGIALLKQGINTVISLDTAMIDLRKTTSATDAEYEQFYKTANTTAKQLGSTTEAVIAQTAEWSRLGYTLEEASMLAKNSAIFAAVSPEMSQETATDGLVSIIKAFDIDVDDTMDGIISKVNSIGNAFAVSNADIVEALQRSSSAMAAANNTFDETVALATAAIEITRDANSVGNALKTISMRIRGKLSDAPYVQKCA